MNDANVAIIDYGLSNLYNIIKACEAVGMKAAITQDPDKILKADAAILPGVGAFADAMSFLREKGLDAAIKDFIISGRPFMGICLGLQLLFSESHEFGVHKGLDIIPGVVKKIECPEGTKIKIPHIGWNKAFTPGYSAIKRDKSMLAGVSDDFYFYFIHSYYVEPENKEVEVARSVYGGFEFCSSIQKDNVFACQFHPEKSGVSGLKVYANFLNAVNS